MLKHATIVQLLLDVLSKSPMTPETCKLIGSKFNSRSIATGVCRYDLFLLFRKARLFTYLELIFRCGSRVCLIICFIIPGLIILGHVPPSPGNYFPECVELYLLNYLVFTDVKNFCYFAVCSLCRACLTIPRHYPRAFVWSMYLLTLCILSILLTCPSSI